MGLDYFMEMIRIFFRMINAAKKFKFNNVVRITGDNPLTDIDAIIKMSKSHVKKMRLYLHHKFDDWNQTRNY